MKYDNLHICMRVAFFALFVMVACKDGQGVYTKVEPAHVEPGMNGQLSRITLTEKAIHRLDIKTASVITEQNEITNDELRKVVPYASVIYDPEGATWVYTNPEPLVFVREEIKIDYIKDNKVVLLSGPEVGTVIVTMGVSELYGTEYGIGH